MFLPNQSLARLAVALLLSSSAGAVPTSKDACATGLVSGAVKVLLARPWSSSAYEFCSTYINVPLVTTTVATAHPVKTVATTTSTVTAATNTPLATRTVVVTTTQAPAKRDIPLEGRDVSVIPPVAAFPASIISSACSCISSGIVSKTTSVTATQFLSVTALKTLFVTATAPTLTITTTSTAIVTPTCGARVLVNGDFETGDLTGWSVKADGSNTGDVDQPGQTDSPGHRFTANILPKPNDPGTSRVQLSQSMSVCTGTVYIVSVWYYFESKRDGAYIRVAVENSSVLVAASDPDGVGDWRQVTLTFPATTSNPSLGITMACDHGDGEVFHLDSITITPRP